MRTEFEAKFIDLDIDKFVHRLIKAKAKKIQDHVLMKRCTFDMPNSPRGTFLRVRDEGDKITLTYKVLKSLTLDGMREVEVEVNNFDKTVELLKAIGARLATYEENYRQIYKLNEIEIMIDEWPGIPAFIEVEGPSKKLVHDFSDEFNLSLNNALFGNVDEVYKKISGINISDCKEITFDNPPKK